MKNLNMKRTILFLSAICLLALACKKLDADQPEFDVTVDQLTFKLTDTVKFNLSGNADYVQFYSGEAGKNYDLKDTYSTTVTGNPEFQFNSAVQGGNAISKGLTVLISNDFNGIYDQQNVRNAVWTDITNRVTLATTATSVSSGVVNVNDLKSEGKPLYLAFKYSSLNPITSNQWQWTISGFQFRTKHPNGVVYTNAADNAGAAFGPIEFAGDSARWVSGTSLTHVGLKSGFPADEDWAISRSFSLNKTNSDANGVAVVKNLSSVPLPPQYLYKYSGPGTYKAVFVVKNATRKSNKEKLVKFDITITP